MIELQPTVYFVRSEENRFIGTITAISPIPLNPNDIPSGAEGFRVPEDVGTRLLEGKELISNWYVLISPLTGICTLRRIQLEPPMVVNGLDRLIRIVHQDDPDILITHLTRSGRFHAEYLGVSLDNPGRVLEFFLTEFMDPNLIRSKSEVRFGDLLAGPVDIFKTGSIPSRYSIFTTAIVSRYALQVHDE